MNRDRITNACQEAAKNVDESHFVFVTSLWQAQMRIFAFASPQISFGLIH
jgi:hypothetical protein